MFPVERRPSDAVTNMFLAAGQMSRRALPGPTFRLQRIGRVPPRDAFIRTA